MNILLQIIAIAVSMSAPLVVTVISQALPYGTSEMPQLRDALIIFVAFQLFLRVSNPFITNNDSLFRRVCIVLAYAVGCAMVVTLWGDFSKIYFADVVPPAQDSINLLIGFVFGFLLVYFACFSTQADKESQLLKGENQTRFGPATGTSLWAIVVRTAVCILVPVALCYLVYLIKGTRTALASTDLAMALLFSLFMIMLIFFGAEKELRKEVFDVVKRAIDAAFGASSVK